MSVAAATEPLLRLDDVRVSSGRIEAARGVEPDGWAG